MKTKADLVQYLYRCAFSPVVHTWTKAINAGYFATWPGLTSELVHKHLPTPATGHQKDATPHDKKSYTHKNCNPAP